MNDNLVILDNGVVPVYRTDSGEQVVYGRELWKVLESKQDFSTWMKKRISECDAVENEDYCRFHEKMEANNATKIEYLIKIDTAKEIAMLERTEVGKNVRKHFIEVEKKYKQISVDRSNLSPTLQMVYALADQQARVEMEQKRQAEQIERIEQKQEAITETFATTKDTEDFKEWVNRSITKIVDSPRFTNGSTKNIRYANARNESYSRLKKKWRCNLDDRVSRAKGRALENRPNIKKTELDSINKLSVIADDKSLRPCYETVIKEMMIFYCV